MKKHDTYHQSGGLSGVHYHHDNTLDAETCATSVQKGHRFLFNQQWYSYQRFCDTYPEWKLPSHQIRLKLREYIFCHCHKRIAEIHDLKPCSNVPSDFNHDLTSIKNELMEKIGADYNILEEIWLNLSY